MQCQLVQVCLLIYRVKLYILLIIFLIARVPNKNLDKTPYEFWKNKKPSLKYFKVWGCLVKINICITKKRKIGLKTINCAFVGYSLNSITCRCLVINSNIPEILNNTTISSCGVIFFENIFPMKSKLSKPSFEGFFFPTIDIVNDHVRKCKKKYKSKRFWC